jgi:hypothetical protein
LGSFRHVERVSQYAANQTLEGVPAAVTIEPGEIVTLSR